MRKLIFLMAALMALAFVVPTGCTQSKPEAKDSVADSDTTATEELDSIDSLIATTPMPKAADELFDDFIFNYAANRQLQLHRTVFPLPVVQGRKLNYLQRRNWRMEHFFMAQGFYTRIVSDRRQMALVKDTAVSRVMIEKIHLATGAVDQFLFGRTQGKWMLQKLVRTTLGHASDADFLTFYSHFATDTAYQVAHVADPFTFTGPDPTTDDDATMTGTLYAEQWPMFMPELPQATFCNIDYGQRRDRGNKRIFNICGIANSLEQSLTFEKREGEWMLTKLEL